MSDAMGAVREFLRADEMTFRDDDGGRVVVPFADEDGRWSATVAEANGCVVCTAGFPANVPEEFRPAAAELLCRLNWPLLLGNWEMDWSDGEVRFRASLPVGSVDLTPDLARDLCYTAFGTFTRGWRPLMDVATGAATAAEAIDAGRSRRARERAAFAAIWTKLGFAPNEDPWTRKPDAPSGGDD